MSPAAKLTQTDKSWFAGLPEQLEKAVVAYDLPNTDDWEPMAEISSNTIFEGIEVHSDSIVRDNSNMLVAAATVFVELVYDPNSDEPVSFHDSYPARVLFDANKQEKKIFIKSIEVDNSSFFK